MKSVEIEGLSKWFRKKHALKQVSLKAYPGEIIAILGSTGSGKSTLLYILAGLLKPSRGRVMIEGVSVIRSPHQVRHLAQIVFSHPCLDPGLTVSENLEWAARLRGLTGTRLQASVSESLHAMRLAGISGRPARTLSDECRQRLEIARGLTGDAPVRLLDNPTGPLDPDSRTALRDYLEARQRLHGETVLWATNDPAEAERADRVALLEAGELLAFDTPEGLRKRVAPDEVVLHTLDDVQAASELRKKLYMEIQRRPDGIHIAMQRPEVALPHMLSHLEPEITSLVVRQPTFAEAVHSLRAQAREGGPA
ncbi:MAG: ABC transporter ATP-binding protein [Armatimonadetes bacterium]|nr:ABC transporter ATP-binding protein [Armatimonadota bacterium]